MLRNEREELFRDIQQRIPVTRRITRPLLAFACAAFACAVVLVLFVATDSARHTAAREWRGAKVGEVVRPAPTVRAAPRVDGARTVSLQGRGELVLAPHTVATLPPSLDALAQGAVSVHLESGRIDATVSPRGADEPFSIVTPQVTVVVVGTRFSVEVDGSATTVGVEHGRVRVEGPRGSAFVGAGESIRSDDASFGRSSAGSAQGRVPLAAVPPPEAMRVPASEPAAAATRASRFEPATRPPSCAGLNLGGRRDCLSRAASSRGLDGENALLSLALFERNELGDGAAAVSHLREHQRRYPNGALAPEVALALAATLAAGGATEAACTTADDYARRFPRDHTTIERLRTFCARR
jgi:hypothetical protein